MGNLGTGIRNKVRNSDGSISTVRTISIGTERGEVLIPTVINNRVVSDDEAIRHFERTGENYGTFKTPEEATGYAGYLHDLHSRQLQKRSEPVNNGASVVQSLFPNARVTDSRRDPNSRLGRANPKSWHVKSGGAVDVAPIPGMTFGQYVNRIRKAGYKVIEAIDEVKNPSGHATGPHWHVVIGQ